MDDAQKSANGQAQPDSQDPVQEPSATNPLGGTEKQSGTEALGRVSVNSFGVPVDPPIVDPRPAYSPSPEFGWLREWLAKDAYGAPRVFDLYTLLAITLAFALLFAALRLLEPLLFESLPPIAIGLGTFVTLIAVAQIVLWGGEQPRIASLVAGPIALSGIGLIGILFSRSGPSAESILGLSCLAVLGIFAGYLGGAVVAGVFLVADAFRKKFMKEPDPLPANDDAIWDTSDQGQDSEIK